MSISQPFRGRHALSLCALSLAAACAALAGCGGSTNVPGVASSVPAGPPAPANNIVFTSTRDGRPQIYSMSAAGGAQTRLTTDIGNDTMPDISADQTKIAYSSTQNGNAEIYVANSDGSSPVRLTVDNGVNAPVDDSPVFSHDGTKIAWRSTRGGASNIWIMSSTGANQTQFTHETAASNPAFSPDGTTLAFVAQRGANLDLILRTIATNVDRILITGLQTITHPRFSPDGTLLAYSISPANATSSTIMVMRLSNGNTATVPGSGSNSSNPSFSPDGTTLVFDNGGTLNAAPQIYTGNVGVPTPTRITTGSTNSQPAWTP